ncbi:hypothetical protein JCM9279_003625 [Rhodotorula babjevae]
MSSTSTLGHKLPRKSSTKGRHIAQRDPLPKGASCQTCRARKVRCDAGKPACRACLRTARFEGRDEASVVCCYDKRPVVAKKAVKRTAASKAQQTAAAVSQGAVDPASSHHASSSSQSTPYSSTFPNPYLTSFPLTSRADSYESLAASYYTAAPAAPQHTPTPPLSYSSANSPEDSVLAHSPPDQHPHISRPPSTSAYSIYATTGGVPSSASAHGFHLPPIVPGPHVAYSPYQSLTSSQHIAKPSSSYSFAPPPMRETSSAWSSQPAAHSSYAPQVSYAHYGDDGGGPARVVYGEAYMQQAQTSAHQSPLPRIEPYGRATPAHGPPPSYTAKRSDLAGTLAPPRLSSTLASSYSNTMPPIVPAQQQASRYSQQQRTHPGAGGGAYTPASHAQQPSHTPQDPTFSLPMQHQQAGPGFAAARSPFPLYTGTSGGGGGGASGGGTVWPTLPSPSAPIGWTYPPAAGGGGGRTASTSGYSGPVDEWLRGLAT